MLGVRPPLPPLKYENLADEEIKDGEEVEEQPGMIYSFFSGVRDTIASAFSWCTDETEEEMINTERASAQVLQRFSIQFNENYKLVANG